MGWSVCESTSGGYLAVGYTTGFGATDGDGFIVKTTDQGVLEWQNHFGKSGLDVIYDIDNTNDLNYIATGITGEQGSEFQEAWLVKIGPSGDTLWSHIYGGYRKSYGYSVRQTADDGYIFCGITNASGTNVYDIMLVKTTSDGVITSDEIITETDNILTIYPNPVQDQVSVEFPSGSKRIILTSLSGKIILEESITNRQKITLNVDGLSSGPYFLTVTHAQFTLSKKLVIR
jgi:hypothetical protein